MTCINDPIPWELWVCIANFSSECNYNLFFTNKKFFTLINHYKFNTNVIQYAVEQGNLDIIKHINKLKMLKDPLINDEKFTSFGLQKYFLTSCYLGQLECIKYFVKCGANVRANNNEAIRTTVSNGPRTKLMLYFEYFGKGIQQGYMECIEFLVKCGANVQAKNNEAIQSASSLGHLECVKFLVRRKANVRANDNYSVKIASKKGHIEVVKFLVERGADVKAGNNCAVQWASEMGHLEVVKFLVEKGADIKADNNRAVQWASRNGLAV
ncbi:putative ankyrin repeat protein [Cotonvirus japonicus]|uniref:Ankyrin repeat protein n=1 Tax=Cotonvirus japonicus TaxID=2811091 RepID=A0ABM7NRP7_9VIRU|nr:putative ankyrin repeat protein [Cotonvirus japonicus]BCS82766.1 putative ankyrin repeat protein [Cotonvirus japonicus]